MNKNALSERDICTKFITPALREAGWDEMSQIREEVSFTKGCIIVRGKLVSRGKGKRADYILYLKPNIPLALSFQFVRRPHRYRAAEAPLVQPARRSAARHEKGEHCSPLPATVDAGRHDRPTTTPPPSPISNPIVAFFEASGAYEQWIDDETRRCETRGFPSHCASGGGRPGTPRFARGLSVSEPIQHPFRSIAGVMISLVLFLVVWWAGWGISQFLGFNAFYINILVPFVSAAVSPNIAMGILRNRCDRRFLGIGFLVCAVICAVAYVALVLPLPQEAGVALPDKIVGLLSIVAAAGGAVLAWREIV